MDRLGSADILLFEGFRLDRSGGGLFRVGQGDGAAPVALGSRALDLLGLLVDRQGELVSKDAIMEAVWPRMVVEEGNLTVHISALRHILDQNREEGSCIQTVPGRGYRFIAPVTRGELAASPVSTPASGNGSGRPIAADGKPQSSGALGQLGGMRHALSIRSRHWFWGGVTATVIGALVLVAAMEAGIWHLPWSGDEHPAPRLSIVVLPFTNLGDDPGQQYFADGVTEDVTTDLSRIEHMFVISRNTAFTYRNKQVDTKQIGHELGVRYVMEGSVRRSGNQLRVSARLIDAETNAHLWAERFDRDMGDLFALQNEITSRIATALNLQMVAAEAARPTEHLDALDYMLRGGAAGLKRASRDGYAVRISMYERALALDSRSAEAKSRLASAVVDRALDFGTSMVDGDIERAEELATQAVTASPRSALAHFARGQVLRVQRRCEEAIPEYETALALDRNWAAALAAIGRCKTFVGPIEEAIPLLEQAIRLSPRDPRIDGWYARIGIVHLLQSRTDDAILWLEKARIANLGLWYVHAYLASAYALKGETERAAVELAEAKRLAGDDRFSSIARVKAIGFFGPPENFGVPKIRALFDATYFAGLRKAGVPEE